MNTPHAQFAPPDETAVDSVPEHVSQNIDSILAFYRREERKISDSQRLLETVGGFMGRPSYLAFGLAFVALWLLANALCRLFGFQPLDPPPFFWLQGIVSLGALLTTTVVLITQNREAKIEAQRLELELQVILLTEEPSASHGAPGFGSRAWYSVSVRELVMRTSCLLLAVASPAAEEAV